MIEAVDKNLWAARKVFWADIEFRLSFDKWHSKSELKVFEAYFVKGKEPNIHPLEEDPIPLVYRLWLAPDQSLESWEAITRNFLAGPQGWPSKFSYEPAGTGQSWTELLDDARRGWQIGKSLDVTYDILMKRATADFLDGATPFQGSQVIPPLGYMGGAEKKLYEFLAGLIPGSERFRYRGEPLFRPSSRFGHLYYRNLCIWIDGRRPHNAYSLYNYLAEFWFETLSEKRLQEAEEHPPTKFYLDCYLKLLARDIRLAAEDERGMYCKKIRSLLDSTSLPKGLQVMWDEAKNFRGKININEITPWEEFNVGDF